MTARSADTQPRLGVLGGTFDPVHLGHLTSALACAGAFELDPVLLLLSARPPHKGEKAEAPVADRWAMIQLSVETDPRLQACDLEVRREGPSYTSDTLAELAGLYPDHSLYLILGEDAYREIDSWHRPDLLLERANLIVTSRPGEASSRGDRTLPPPFAAQSACCYDPAINGYVHSSGHRLIEYALGGVDVSSSEVRRRARAGQPLDSLTGPAVAAYIADHGLYRARPDSAKSGDRS